MRFKIGDRVLVHLPGGLRIGDTITEIPHDCSDPKMHRKSRVTGWSTYDDCLEVATPYGDNPHRCEWPYATSSLTPPSDEGADWVDSSPFRVGMEIFFKNDGHSDDYVKDAVLPCLISAAHIKTGDWIVYYFRPRLTTPIKRVVNESLMLLGR